MVLNGKGLLSILFLINDEWVLVAISYLHTKYTDLYHVYVAFYVCFEILLIENHTDTTEYC